MAWNQNFGEGANQSTNNQAWRDNFNGGQAAGQVKVPTAAPKQSAPAPKAAPVAQKAPVAARPPNGVVSAKPVGKMQDYIEMITDAAFGGQDPTAAISGRVAPVPHTRPTAFTPKDEAAVDDAVNRGFSLEQIAAGAAGGATVALAAKSLIDRMRANDGTSANQNIPLNGTAPARKPSGGVSVLPPGKPGLPQNSTSSKDLTMGQPSRNNNIDAMFGTYFEMPSPDMITGGDRLVTYGDTGRTAGVKADAYQPQSSIPGPNPQQKRIGDMDSPQWADQNVPDYTTQEAQRIKDQMDQFGITDPAEFGITRENRPSLYKSLMSLM
jgi:hypothetical protein